MMDDLILNYIILFMLLEIYEVQWQKANTLIGMLSKMYQYYSRNIFLFLIMHPTFYFTIGFMVLCEYNIFSVTLFSIKALDIAMKIVLIKQVFIDKETSDEMTLALLTPLNKLLPYLGVLIYPPIIYFALV